MSNIKSEVKSYELKKVGEMGCEKHELPATCMVHRRGKYICPFPEVLKCDLS